MFDDMYGEFVAAMLFRSLEDEPFDTGADPSEMVVEDLGELELE